MPIYAGTFLIAFSTLALQVALTRLLSVVTWYHLAFFAISTAMLGMTAGAVRVYLKGVPRDDRTVERAMARASIGFAAAVPVSLLVLLRLPLPADLDLGSVAVLGAVALACSLPFYFAGIAVTLVLTRHSLPVPRVYGADLVGAAMGCLFVLGGLEAMDVPSLVLLCGAVGAAAALLFTLPAGASLRVPGLTLAALLLAATLNAALPWGLQPTTVKGHAERPESRLLERWNSFSRVVMTPRAVHGPWYWGASPHAPHPPLPQHRLEIDGEAGTPMGRFAAVDDIAYLAWDVTNVAYHLHPPGGAAIIGVGGGRDVQSAVLFGHDPIVGVEVNPVFVDLLRGEFREFAGIADRPEVTLHVDDARSFLARDTAHYGLIQMSMIDTWAATGAGAYSHTESGLYTVEAWSRFLDRLRPEGILTVSRWHHPRQLGETARGVSLAVAALLEAGVEDPAAHVALVTSGRLSTLLVSRAPFGPGRLATLRGVVDRLGFQASVLPGEPAAHPRLAALLGARSRDELDREVAAARLDLRPPTDDRPYFFNMLRFRDVLRPEAVGGQQGVVAGNKTAATVLLVLIFYLALLTAATIVVPLAAGPRPEARRFAWSGAAYFSLIGGGFMLVEIGLVQRLSVFLGHPVYALGVLLFTIILSTGTGSLLSERWPLVGRAPRIAFPLATAALLLLLAVALPEATRALEATHRAVRIAASVVLVFPVGVLMGFFFPTGMASVAREEDGATPWYWALNGIFGVLFSALAVLISIYLGMRANLLLAAAMYAATAPLLAVLGSAPARERTRRRTPPPAAYAVEPSPAGGP